MTDAKVSKDRRYSFYTSFIWAIADYTFIVSTLFYFIFLTTIVWLISGTIGDTAIMEVAGGYII